MYVKSLTRWVRSIHIYGVPGQSMRGKARQGKNKQKHIIQYQYLIKVLKWKLEFVVAVVAGDVAPRKTTRRLIRRTHISATDKRQQRAR